MQTVDLVRFDQGASRQGKWHILRGPFDQETLCNFAVPETALIERGLDARVVSHRGVTVCAHCIGKRT